MRTAFLLLAFAVLPGSASPQTAGRQTADASSLSAQSSDTQATAAAIEAFVRGDYARAAELLEPLERRWTASIDSSAAFFLAALYEDGLGVPQNEIRACALRVRGQYDPSGPFGRLGYALARAKMNELGPYWSRECEMLANLGFHHGFAPARFALDVDRWVAIDLSSERQDLVATVSYVNREKTASLISVPMGAVFLPIEYTRLGSGFDGATPRHFVEVAMWVPEATSTWRLLWSLGEIVEADVVAVTTATLTTIETDTPPDDVSLRLRDLVALRVNDAGHAEFEILNERDSRREGIPTVAERRERADEVAKRQAADKKVDWKRRLDPARPPSFTYADADGCYDLFIYGWSASRAEAIAIRANRRLLDLSAAPRTFDLAIPQGEIEVVAEVYDRPQSRPFCTDIGDGSVRRESWRAVGGTLTIQLSPGVRATAPEQYRATVQIDNAEFVSDTGQRVRSPQPIRLTAISGQGGGSIP